MRKILVLLILMLVSVGYSYEPEKDYVRDQSVKQVDIGELSDSLESWSKQDSVELKQLIERYMFMANNIPDKNAWEKLGIIEKIILSAIVLLLLVVLVISTIRYVRRRI